MDTLHSLHLTMLIFCTHNPASEVLWSPSFCPQFLLIPHGTNMSVLCSFSSSIENILGQEQVVPMFMSSVVIFNFVSYVCKVATLKSGPSLGASGSIMAILAAICTMIPDRTLLINFLRVFAFVAANALKEIIVLDTAERIQGFGKFLFWRCILAELSLEYGIYCHDLI